jgi:hypothetical protein
MQSCIPLLALTAFQKLDFLPQTYSLTLSNGLSAAGLLLLFYPDDGNKTSCRNLDPCKKTEVTDKVRCG